MTYNKFIKVGFSAAQGDDHTGAGAAYVALGTATSSPAYAIIISSSFDKSIFLSIDGTTDHIFVPPAMMKRVDFGANKEGTGKYILHKGTQFYLKQGPDGAPTTGDLYISFLIGR